MFTNLNNVLRDEEGATLVEYGLLVSLIAVACLVIIRTLGGTIQSLFKNVNTNI